MSYSHTPERSAELLRQALPLMSRLGAALHPTSYALWYAYVADAQSPLRQEVDQLLARHGKLDEASTEVLVQRHLAQFDAQTAERLGNSLQSVVGVMSAQAALANDQTQEYGQALERIAAALHAEARQPQPNQPAPAVLDELLAHTQQMRAHMTQLQNQLTDSQREIEQLRREVESARQESLLDTLTGLANRRAFDRRLAECLAAHRGQTQRPPEAAGQAAGSAHPPCLLLADLDHFKRINDTYGHGFGDQVLRAVAQLMQSIAPANALAARIGGEEFALLLPGATLDQALALAETLRAKVAANRIRRKGQSTDAEHVTVSLGAVSWRHEDSPQAFVDRADRALYAAKDGGRDRVVVDR